ncbi:MAG: prepilin-type N-terminal cleavage/methylation domain-containing protein, partial [Elusimicrobiaceae bacterium]|nr:prepilin-type N-terminal cleavage/methylation domain-containing protein [Elusimicrobiaceae bacterium]
KKNGFTLMELLVSIFITGMVMLSLVAMWKTSSSQSSQAQRQAIIKNENTIFLRKLYSDFISASEVICPWGQGYDSPGCEDNYNIAIHNAAVTSDASGNLSVVRTTGPVCSSQFQNDITTQYISNKCVPPYFVAYIFENGGVYKCSNVNKNTDATNPLIKEESVALGTYVTSLRTYCEDNENKELILPYVLQFSLTVPNVNGHLHNESLLVDYTIRKDFSAEVPPVVLKFRRYFMKHKGV